jgi:hypothetical protein
MPLLNYTTSVPAPRTLSEIHNKLAKAGAHQILQEYFDGHVTAVSFRIKTQFGDMAFRLPANVQAVWIVLKKQFPRSKMKLDQAERVAWRILKDWIESQLALIETDQATLAQVFLPYAQDSRGVTLYETLEQKKFSGFALEDRK